MLRFYLVRGIFIFEDKNAENGFEKEENRRIIPLIRKIKDFYFHD